MLRRDCHYFLRYGNRNFCRFVWTKDIFASPRELLSCDIETITEGDQCSQRCPDYRAMEFKRRTLPPEERECLEADDAKTGDDLSWEDAEDTKNELPK